HLPYFLLVVCRPRRSTLFPYTTLFRSCPDVIGELLGRARHDVCALGGKALLYLRQLQRLDDLRAQALDDRRRRPGGRDDALILLDRKSTRLNSSHVKISYAVFCLKKKI